MNFNDVYINPQTQIHYVCMLHVIFINEQVFDF